MSGPWSSSVAISVYSDWTFPCLTFHALASASPGLASYEPSDGLMHWNSMLCCLYILFCILANSQVFGPSLDLGRLGRQVQSIDLS